VIANVEAGFDDCTGAVPIKMTSRNVGDSLNSAGVTWGWFYDSFARIGVNADGTAICSSVYNNHYNPFQYYASTANPPHMPPSSVDMIGQADQANHQYDLRGFSNAAIYGTLPAISFIKFQSQNTGHPSDSTALAEQRFLIETINALERLPQWSNMAIMITYDDSDGWYDHVMPPIVNQSSDPANDTLLGSGMCGTASSSSYLDRCGYGARLPFLVVSPFAKRNFVDSTVTDTTSILRFIEDNWNLGRMGDQSFDAMAGSVLNMFNFTQQPACPWRITNRAKMCYSSLGDSRSYVKQNVKPEHI
jgi:phospholipase C